MMPPKRKGMEIFEGMAVGEHPLEEAEHGIFIEHQQYGFVGHIVFKTTRTTAHKAIGGFGKDLTV